MEHEAMTTPSPKASAEQKACPNHHYRAWGYCPYCREHLTPPPKDQRRGG